MARLLLVACFALCSSCMQLYVPAPRIEFTAIDYNAGLYNLRFRSDRDLVNLYRVHGINEQVGAWLKCSLDGDADFSVIHKIRLYGDGVVRDVRVVEGDRRYEFDVSFRFEEDVDQNGSSMSIRKEVLLSLLRKRDYIPCRVTITATFYNAYYSKIMYVPTSRIIAEVQKQITAPEYVILPPEHRQLSWLQFEQVCITERRYYAGDTIVHGGVCSGLPYSGLLSSFAPLKGRFRIVDAHASPRPNVHYILKRADGREEHGLSDAQGDTHMFGSNYPESTMLLLFEEGLDALVL